MSARTIARASRWPRSLLPALLLAAGLLLLWQALIWAFAISANLLPAPVAVLQALVAGLAGGELLTHIGVTAADAALGCLIGVLAGMLLGILVAESRLANGLLQWPVRIVQAVPKVAIAPLLFFWFGFGTGAKLAMVILTCFFPVFVGTVNGLRAVDPLLGELYRSACASRTRTLFELSLPAALDQILAGVQVSVVLSLVGCIVMEFMGATSGLGYVIQIGASTLDLPTTFAAIIAIGLIGWIGNALVQRLHRRLVFWRADRHETGIHVEA